MAVNGQLSRLAEGLSYNDITPPSSVCVPSPQKSDKISCSGRRLLRSGAVQDSSGQVRAAVKFSKFGPQPCNNDKCSRDPIILIGGHPEAAANLTRPRAAGQSRALEELARSQTTRTGARPRILSFRSSFKRDHGKAPSLSGICDCC
jgi:hypothetical protein